MALNFTFLAIFLTVMVVALGAGYLIARVVLGPQGRSTQFVLQWPVALFLGAAIAPHPLLYWSLRPGCSIRNLRRRRFGLAT